MRRYEAELKQLLAGPGLSPETRARTLAALIVADAVTDAAGRVHSAAQTTLGDTMPILMDAVRSFGEKAQNLAWALDASGEPASAPDLGARANGAGPRERGPAAALVREPARAPDRLHGISSQGEATVRPVAREIIRICGVAVVAGGLAAALALIFVPLGLQTTATTVGFCGPGLTSDNALQVRIDPGIVNTGGTPGQLAPAADQQQLERFCTREADTRLTEAAVTAAVALLLGIGVPVLVSKRSMTPSFRPPMQPWAPGPP